MAEDTPTLPAGNVSYLRSQTGRQAPPEPPPISKVKVRSLSEILGTQASPRTWFFEEILPAGAFLIVGRPKVGKSWLLLQLALCAAGAGQFLGFEALNAFGVLYIAAEDDDARVQSRFRTYRISDVPERLHMILRDELDALAVQYAQSMRFAEWLDFYLAAHPEISVVIIDTESTVRAIWDGDRQVSEQSITRKDYSEVREFDHIALRRRAFIGLVNHTGKRKSSHWTDIHELINRTNTAMAGASGSIVLADPPGHDPTDTENRVRVLGIRGRDITNEYLLAVKQDDFAVFQNLGPYVDHRKTEAEEEILEALEEMREEDPEAWHTSGDVAAWLGKNAGSVKRTISRMMKKGARAWKHYTVETRKKVGIRLLAKETR